MQQEKLIYPVIITECNDESGHYFGVTSPNIKGMVTDGKTMQEAVSHAEDAIATMIDGEKYPEVQDPRQWDLQPNEFIAWVPVNMKKWKMLTSKTVSRTITLPKELNAWAKKNNINVSAVTRSALSDMVD